MTTETINEMTTLEKCPRCGAKCKRTWQSEHYFECGTTSLANSLHGYSSQSDLCSELCRAPEAKQKAEAELAEIKRDYHQPELCNERIMGLEAENAKLREILDRLFTDGISCLEIHQIRAEYNQLTK